jgi:hypothetical protein
MAYAIEYLRSGKVIGSTPRAGDLADTKRVAREGLIKYQADSFRIYDENGEVVTTEKKSQQPK